MTSIDILYPHILLMENTLLAADGLKHAFAHLISLCGVQCIRWLQDVDDDRPQGLHQKLMPT